MSASTELAWAAGFFDGEGCVFLHKQGRGSARVDVAQTEPTTLERFRNAVGFGKVYGPYDGAQKAIGKKDYWRYTCCAREEVADVLNKLWPYLSEPKKIKALEVYKNVKR